MKKILIASHCMELGGAERSLLGILNAMDYHKYEVDLFLYRHTGELLKYIPKEVNLLPEDKQMSMLAIPFQNVIKKCNYVALHDDPEIWVDAIYNWVNNKHQLLEM